MTKAPLPTRPRIKEIIFPISWGIVQMSLPKGLGSGVPLPGLAEQGLGADPEADEVVSAASAETAAGNMTSKAQIAKMRENIKSILESD